MIALRHVAIQLRLAVRLAIQLRLAVRLAIQLRLAVRLAVQLRQLRDAWRSSKSECHGSGMVRRLGKLANISGIAASLPLGVSGARQSVLPFGSSNKDTSIEVQYEVNWQEP